MRQLLYFHDRIALGYRDLDPQLPHVRKINTQMKRVNVFTAYNSKYDLHNVKETIIIARGKAARVE